MNTIKTFFPIIRAIFSIFTKGQGRPPLLPANCAPYISPDIRIHPKTIVNTSHQNFDGSIKIAAENSQSVLSLVIKTLSHMSTFTNIIKTLKQSLKIKKNNPAQLHKKLAFNIFHVVPNFANILTTVKIVKNSCRQKSSLSLNVQKQPFKSLAKQVVPNKSRKVILKSRHRHLCIGTGVSIGIQIQILSVTHLKLSLELKVSSI